MMRLPPHAGHDIHNVQKRAAERKESARRHSLGEATAPKRHSHHDRRVSGGYAVGHDSPGTNFKTLRPSIASDIDVSRKGSKEADAPPPPITNHDLAHQLVEVDRKLDRLMQQVYEYQTGLSNLNLPPNILDATRAPKGDNQSDSDATVAQAWRPNTVEEPSPPSGLPAFQAVLPAEACVEPTRVDTRVDSISSKDDKGVKPSGSGSFFQATGSLASWPESRHEKRGSEGSDASSNSSQGARHGGGTCTFADSVDRPRISSLMRDSLKGAWMVPWTRPWLVEKTLELRFVMDDPESGTAGRLYSVAMPFFVVLSVIPTMLQTADDPAFRNDYFSYTEVFCESVFLADVLLRFFLASSPKGFFVESAHNIIDILCVLPLILRAYFSFTPSPEDLDEMPGSLLLYIVPLVRLLKTLRGFRKFNLILTVAAEVYFDTIPAVFMMAYFILALATVFYYVEPRENIPTYSKSLWFCCVTITTVGYGDISPSSTLGYAVGFLMVCSSVFVMALPLGIIGTAVSEIWKDRDTIILRNWAKDRLDRWGYKAADFSKFFKMFDNDGDGAVNFSEFCEMLGQMTIGIKPERTRQLFRAFDEDGSGTVDAEEFVLKLYPEQYEELYPATRLTLRKSTTIMSMRGALSENSEQAEENL